MPLRPLGLGPFVIALPPLLPVQHFVLGASGNDIETINAEMIDKRFVLVWGCCDGGNVPDRLIVGFSDDYDKRNDGDQETWRWLIQIWMTVSFWAGNVIEHLHVPLATYLLYQRHVRLGSKLLANAGLGAWPLENGF